MNSDGLSDHRITDEACRHESATGDEGPVPDRGSAHVVRWRCDGCGAIHYSDAALAALRAEVGRLRAVVQAVGEHHYEDGGGCVSCVDEFDNPQAWPCATAVALGDSRVSL